MMSHCTASLKLTPWHEGTFASSVIYSPPQRPPFPLFLPSLVSNPLCPHFLSRLPQNDIHYFFVKQASFFSCSPGPKRKGRGKKMRHRKAKSRLHGGNWSSSLCDPGPLLKMALCCSVEAGMWQTLWGNTAACIRQTLLVSVCQSLQGFRPAPITYGQNNVSAHSQMCRRAAQLL